MMSCKLVFAPLLISILTVSAASAGPCNVRGKDAGSGPTPGYTGQTTGMAATDKKTHPPTQTMNRATADKAASAQDAQRQQQGQPTAAQEAMGAKPRPDEEC
jgi:hypothetical protein